MAGLRRNVANQKWRVFAFNITTGAAVTGDSANITAKIAKDWGTATATSDVNPTEIEDGYYLFDLTQAESDANVLDIYPESSTPNVQVIGVPGTVFTIPKTSIDTVADLIESQRGSHTYQGNAWYVAPTTGSDITGDGSRNNPYATVTKAHTEATDNNHDVIFLLADNTVGSTTLTEQVTISKNYIFIRGPGRDFFWNYGAAGDVITITGTGVELSGFVLDTHTVGSGKGVQVSGDFCKIRHIWLNYARTHGIYITNADWCQIYDNTIHGCGKDAASAGIYVFQSGGGTAAHNAIYDNSIDDNIGAGIETSGAVEDLVIKHNNIHGQSTYGVIIGTGTLTTGVYDNTFSANTSGDVDDSGTGTYREVNNITHIQPGIGTPPKDASLAYMQSMLYKALVNESDQSSGLFQLKNRDGITVDQKATVSSVSGTITKEELISGP